MEKHTYLFWLLLLSPVLLLSQQRLPANQNYYSDGQAGIVYNREFTVDIKAMSSRAFSLGVNFSRIQTYYRTRFINFEFGNLRHPQEYRQSFEYPLITSRISRAFIFGKQNSLFTLRGGIGEKRYFSEKAKRKGLAIGMSYQLGPTLGIVKPYYLDVNLSQDPGANNILIRPIKYDEEVADKFLDIERIAGSSSFSRGLDELKLMPGGHAKLAVHFDWGAFDEFVKVLEAGLMVDVFLRDAPIMVESPLVPTLENRPLFFNLYLNLQLGKRW